MERSFCIYWYKLDRNLTTLSKDIHAEMKLRITPLLELEISIMTLFWKCIGHFASISIVLTETWAIYQKIYVQQNFGRHSKKP